MMNILLKVLLILYFTFYYSRVHVWPEGMHNFLSHVEFAHSTIICTLKLSFSCFKVVTRLRAYLYKGTTTKKTYSLRLQVWALLVGIR